MAAIEGGFVAIAFRDIDLDVPFKCLNPLAKHLFIGLWMLAVAEQFCGEGEGILERQQGQQGNSQRQPDFAVCFESTQLSL